GLSRKTKKFARRGNLFALQRLLMDVRTSCAAEPPGHRRGNDRRVPAHAAGPPRRAVTGLGSGRPSRGEGGADGRTGAVGTCGGGPPAPAISAVFRHVTVALR